MPSEPWPAAVQTLADHLDLPADALFVRPACQLCSGADHRPVVSEDFAGCRLQAVRCAACGFCYTTPRPSLLLSQTLRRPEVRNSLVDAGILESERRTGAATIFDYDKQLDYDANYRRGLRVLQRRRPAGRLLDVGCAGGRFVELAGEGGYEACGCDIVPEALTPGLARGLDLRLAPPNGLPDGLPPLQVATLWNVLEHVERPQELLRAVAQALEPGGLVLVEVPSMALRLALATLGGPKHSAQHRYILYEHIYHYTPRSLARLLQQSGLRLTRFITTHTDGSHGWRSRLRAAVLRAAHHATRGAVNWHYPLACLAERA